jgi:hypothetical protein
MSCKHEEWGNDRYCVGCGKCATEVVAGLQHRLEIAEDGWHMANGTADLAMKHRDEAEADVQDLLDDFCKAMRLLWFCDCPISNCTNGILNMENKYASLECNWCLNYKSLLKKEQELTG